MHMCLCVCVCVFVRHIFRMIEHWHCTAPRAFKNYTIMMNLLLHNSELTIKTSNVGRGSIRNIQIFSPADVCFPVVGTTGIYSNLESQAGCGRVGCLRGVSVDALESEILSPQLQICSRHSKCWFFAALLHYCTTSYHPTSSLRWTACYLTTASHIKILRLRLAIYLIDNAVVSGRCP